MSATADGLVSDESPVAPTEVLPPAAATTVPPTSGISVNCRVRPLTTSESSNPRVQSVVGCLERSIILEPPSSKKQHYMGMRSSQPKSRQFRLDNVFHPHCSQEDVYRTCCAHIVAGLFEGINGSVLAYGATGSGKTHTMFGGGLSTGGVIFQCVEDIFVEREHQHRNGRVVNVSCTFLEVYNEEVFDLLSPAGRRVPLKVQEIAEDKRTASVNPEGLSIKGLTRATPKDMQEFDQIIEKGRNNRFTAATNANEQSSRSHAIISIEVDVLCTHESSVGTSARIRLCDLAGSERAASTMNRGQRMREGGNINKSLLALGAVVQALAKKSKSPPSTSIFIPFRGSKLTRLLRDCLEGNCRTSMVFCVSPNSDHHEESHNTMLFAMQAKLIQLATKRNEFKVNSTEVARNQEAIIERLRAENAAMRRELTLVAQNPNHHVDMSLLHTDGGASGAPSLERGPSPAPLLLTGGSHSSLDGTAAWRDPSMTSEVSALTASASPLRPRTNSSFACDSPMHDSLQPQQLQQAANIKEISEAVQKQKQDANRALQGNRNEQLQLLEGVRKDRCDVAYYLASLPTHQMPDPPPVKIAGLLQSISAKLERVGALQRQAPGLERALDVVEASIKGLHSEVLNQRLSNPMANLYLEKTSLIFGSLDTESLMTDYRQEKCDAEQRLKEAAEAMSRCTSIIQDLLPLAEAKDRDTEKKRLTAIGKDAEAAALTTSGLKSNVLTRRCEEALAFATIPWSETEGLLDNFTSALLQVNSGGRGGRRQPQLDSSSPSTSSDLITKHADPSAMEVVGRAHGSGGGPSTPGRLGRPPMSGSPAATLADSLTSMPTAANPNAFGRAVSYSSLFSAQTVRDLRKMPVGAAMRKVPSSHKLPVRPPNASAPTAVSPSALPPAPTPSTSSFSVSRANAKPADRSNPVVTVPKRVVGSPMGGKGGGGVGAGGAFQRSATAAASLQPKSSSH